MLHFTTCAFAISLMLPFGALADEPKRGLRQTAPMIVPTNHPYAILGLVPGTSQEAALRALSVHFERDLFPENVTINIQSPQGRQFQHEYVQRLTTPWIDPLVRMGNDSYEEIGSVATILNIGVVRFAG